MTRFFHVKKDANHDDIVKTFRQMHCSVVEALRTGMPGFPDIVVGFMGDTHLVEIKNPETSYGKKGLSKNQRDFSEEWKGSKIEQVSNSEVVVRLVQHWAWSKARKGMGL